MPSRLDRAVLAWHGRRTARSNAKARAALLRSLQATNARAITTRRPL